MTIGNINWKMVFGNVPIISSVNDSEKNKIEPSKFDKVLWVKRDVLSSLTWTKIDIFNENITAWQIWQQEAKWWNVMKNFIKSNSENIFDVDFWKNWSAEHNIGLADIMPEWVKKVRIIWERNGRKYDMIWERNGLKWWFYNENWRYLPVYSWFKVEVLEKYDPKELQAKKQENEQKIQEILKSPFIEKFKSKYSQEHLEIIVRKSQEYNIDPTFLLSLRSSENWPQWLEFWVKKAWIDTFEWQLTLACRTIQNKFGMYKRLTWNEPIESDGSIKSEFIGFFSNIYAPIWASNDPRNLNSNHLKNLLTFYWEYRWKKFDNIDTILAQNNEFIQKWNTRINTWELAGKTNPDDLLAQAKLHLWKPYILGWNWISSIDCSQLVIEAMKWNWVVDYWYDNTAEWLSRITNQKSPNEVQKWDLVFIQNSSWKITHVEIALWPVEWNKIPIIDASKSVWWVTTRYQTISSKILVWTPIFYNS